MMSLTILNVNANTNPRLCGFTLLRREKAAWFPTEELRDDNNVQPHKVLSSSIFIRASKEGSRRIHNLGEGILLLESTYLLALSH